MDLNNILTFEEVNGSESNTIQDLYPEYSLEELYSELDRYNETFIAYEEFLDRLLSNDNITLEELNEYAARLGVDISVEDIQTDLGFDKIYTPSIEGTVINSAITAWLINAINRWANGTLTRFNNIFKKLFLKLYYTKINADEYKKLLNAVKSKDFLDKEITIEKTKLLASKEEKFIKTFSKKYNKTLPIIANIFKGGDVYKESLAVRKLLEKEKCIERQKWSITKWLEEDEYILNRPTLMYSGEFTNVYSLGIKVADVIASTKFKVSNIECVDNFKYGTFKVKDLDIDFDTLETILNGNSRIKTILEDTFDSIRNYKEHLLNVIKENEVYFGNKSIKPKIMRTLHAESLYVRYQAVKIVEISDLAIKFVEYLSKLK